MRAAQLLLFVAQSDALRCAAIVTGGSRGIGRGQCGRPGESAEPRSRAAAVAEAERQEQGLNLWFEDSKVEREEPNEAWM